jgi:hypothetical protein
LEELLLPNSPELYLGWTSPRMPRTLKSALSLGKMGYQQALNFQSEAATARDGKFLRVQSPAARLHLFD